MKRISLIALALVVLVGLAGAAVRRPHLPPAERGRRVAERAGCFACHGPGGIRGAANPGRVDETVPNFEGDLMMYARTPEEIREWIVDGVTSTKAHSMTWRAERTRGTHVMPAFRGRLREREVDDLVAYVMAVSGIPDPEDARAARGLARAEALGCTGCHGPGGRLAQPNPGSLKGYVPSWDGADFHELVRDSLEFRQWVERGVSRRLERNRLARHFLGRAALKMPAYEKHLAADDVDALWRYVCWLRAAGATGEEVGAPQASGRAIGAAMAPGEHGNR